MAGIELMGVAASRSTSSRSTTLDGRRLSKSLGTGIDPDLIEAHGADATCYGLPKMSST